MPDLPLTTAVALICFNRPAETQKVMATLRRARPPRLYIIADAPRDHVAGEAERCAQVRAIACAVDWPCELVTDFAPANMGCRDRVISGLNRVFENEECVIILEDDCLAHDDFFPLCQELLARYNGDKDIFAISGDNFQSHHFEIPASYYFSRIFHCWGWATWRDRWQSIDFSMSAWPRLREADWLLKTLGSPVAAAHYRHAFDQTYAGRNSSWAYRASFASLSGGLLNIHPKVNMVTNIGVGTGATHTKNDSGRENRPALGLTFPLTHPASAVINESADSYTFKVMSGSLRYRTGVHIKHLMRRLLASNTTR